MDAASASSGHGDDGWVAVITGASRGIGAGVAAHFAEQGMRLGLCARTTPVVPSGSLAVAAAVDVSDPEAVDVFAESVIDRFGRIDVWVNNAGVLDPIGPLADADAAALARHVDINVLGVAYGSAAFARHVRTRSGTGSLVNLSSGAATSPRRGWAAYCASKAAVQMLTEVIGMEERHAGLLAYAVAPGVVDTDMQALIRGTPVESFPDVDRFRQMADDGVFNTAEWVARMIVERCIDPETRWESEPDRGSVSFRVPDEPS